MNKTNPKAVPPETLPDQSPDDLDFLNAQIRALAKSTVKLLQTPGQPLNELEYNAVLGLMTYIAAEQHISQETLDAILMAKYNVDSIAHLPSALYPNIIEDLIAFDARAIVQ